MNVLSVLKVEALSDELRSRALLLFTLFLSALLALAYYLVPQPVYNHQVNLGFTVFLATLLALAYYAPTRYLQLIAHVFVAAIIAVMAFIAAQTGGTHSSILVWIVVSFIAALLFLGPQATLGWVGVALASQVLLWGLAQAGHIGAHLPIDAATVPWSFMNHVGALCCLMMGLWFMDHIHSLRMQEVKQRNDELLRLHVSLQTAQAHKDEFVAAIGHELRTPMNAILGLNSVLRDEYADQPEVVDTVDHIRRSTQRLLGLVNDILDYSQLQAGRVAFVPEVLHVPSWFAPLGAKYAQLAQEEKLEWATELSPVMVKLDGYRLKQVVEQLLDNAFKFTSAGQVKLVVRYESYFLRLEVHDTGRGIPEHRQQEVFKRFEHADQQTNRAYGGAGLGLAICERLVSLQRGRMGLVSREGQGSMFWVELPCELLEGDAQTPALAAMRHLPSQLRLLVVDDNPVNLMVAKLQIAKVLPVAAIDTARSGEEALELLKTKHYHAALVDMVMPDMDGLALTAKLRALPAPISQMPVVALTANQNPVDIQRCLDAGMNAVLHKPMDEALLKQTLTQWLSQPSAGGEA